MTEDNSDRRAAKLSRRSFTKGLAGMAVGAGVVSQLPTTEAVTNPHTWTHSREANILDKTVHHQSAMHLFSTAFESNNSRWRHDFYHSSQAVATERNDHSERKQGIQNNVMTITSYTSDLNISVGVSDDWRGMYPSDNSNSWGGELTTAINAVATLTGNTVAAAALTATDIVDTLLDAASGGNDGVYQSEESYTGVEEALNHLYIGVSESTCCGLYESVDFYTEIGSNRIEWTLGFTEGDVEAGTSSSGVSSSGATSGWGDPREMSAEQRQRYGVKKVTDADVRGVNPSHEAEPAVVAKNGAAVPMTGETVERAKSDGEVFIASNPPVTATSTGRTMK